MEIMSKEKEDTFTSNNIAFANKLNEKTTAKKAKQSLEPNLQQLELKEQEKNKTFIILEIIEYVQALWLVSPLSKKPREMSQYPHLIREKH